MTTQNHDSTTCTAGANGERCDMCQFAQNASQANSGLFGVEQGQKIDSSPPSASGIPIPAPDFEREWRQAPESHRRYTEKAEAEHWFLRGAWQGIQFAQMRAAVEMNNDLRKTQRAGKE